MTRRKLFILIAVIGLIVLIDQISKNWVLANMQVGQTILVIPALHPYFQFTFSTNTGAAFGIFPMAGNLFLVAALGVSLVIGLFYWQAPHHAVAQQIALACVLGGAAGNVIDRIQHGYVVDFFHLSLPGVISNISNFADHFIVLGVIILIMDTLRSDFIRKRAAKVAIENQPSD